MIGIGLERRIGLDPPRRLVAVHDRKLDVHQDQVGPLLGHRVERLLAVLGLVHFVVGARQQVAQDLPIVLLVLDHQNAFGHGCLACCSALTGSVNEKVEPWPTLDSTQILPAVHLDDALRDGEPQAGAALLLG